MSSSPTVQPKSSQPKSNQPKSNPPTSSQAKGEHAAIAERIIGNIVQASAPAVSPDGRRVAFVVTRVDVAKNKYFSQVWLADADGSTLPRAITNGDHDGAPTWSPDGRSLAFVAKRAEKKGETTLHVVPIDGPGEVRLL